MSHLYHFCASLVENYGVRKQSTRRSQQLLRLAPKIKLGLSVVYHLPLHPRFRTSAAGRQGNYTLLASATLGEREAGLLPGSHAALSTDWGSGEEGGLRCFGVSAPADVGEGSPRGRRWARSGFRFRAARELTVLCLLVSMETEITVKGGGASGVRAVPCYFVSSVPPPPFKPLIV